MITLWTEKYRPKTLSDMVLSADVAAHAKQWIETRTIPHLLLVGLPGTGKTALARVLIKSINAVALELNASDERGIDTIRDKVKEFIQSCTFEADKPKIVFLDEADALTNAAQQALRNMMETWAHNARFILSGNTAYRLIDALQSRCTIVRLEGLPTDQVKNRLRYILDQEGFAYDMQDIEKVIRRYYPDIRAMLSCLQHNVVDFRLVIHNLEADKDLVVQALLSGKLGELKELIKGKNALTLYQSLYDNLSAFPRAARPNIVVILAEGVRWHNITADPEISCLGCLVEIAKAVARSG